MAERFDLLFSPSRVATPSELFYVNNSLRFAHSGISRSMPFLVSFKSRGHIIRVTRVVAPIITKKQIHVVGFLLPLEFLVLYFVAHFPVCFAIHFLSMHQEEEMMGHSICDVFIFRLHSHNRLVIKDNRN